MIIFKPKIIGDEFIEMGAFTNQEITNKYCLKEYKDLI